MAFPETFRAYQYESYASSYQSTQRFGKPHRLHAAGAAGQLFLGKAPSANEPFGIGFDAAGEIVEVGKDVKRLKVGDAVYAITPFSAFGTLSEYSSWTSSMFNHAKLQKGETVLILGGSSSVGMYAIQFARAVVRKAEFVKSLGHQVIDYRKESGWTWWSTAFYNCGMENAAWNEGLKSC
ncbi:NAD(P)-binding domain [Phytophthora cactorum]|nr:NAD(P)-binding domain [Phytophthora cactorum]